jgi:tetratricopeptide (TPR) repeat protein
VTLAALPPSWQRTIVTCVLLGVWCAIVVGGIVTWINPPWMQEFSRLGRMAEASSHSAAGVQRLRAGDFNGAIESFEKSLAIFDDVQTRVHLGIAYAHAGQLQRGLGLLRQALDANPSRFMRGVILFNIAELMFKHPQQHAEAARYYQEALECGAEPDKAHRRLGEILNGQGKLREALVELQNSIQAQLDPAQGYRNMLQRGLEGYNVVPTDEIERDAANGITEKDLARYDLRAIYAFQRVNNPDLATTFNMLGTIHARLGEFAAARAAFDDARQIWPDNPDLARNIEMLNRVERQLSTRRAPQP